MSIPGNKWEEVWDVAQPVPARCQRRLFDDTKELQKALAFFEQPIGKCATNLLPVLMSRVLLKLDMEADETPLNEVRGALDRLIKRAKNFMRPVTVIPKNFEVVLVSLKCFGNASFFFLPGFNKRYNGG